MTAKKPPILRPRDAERNERLKKALKDNLARRKAQAKARAKDEA